MAQVDGSEAPLPVMQANLAQYIPILQSAVSQGWCITIKMTRLYSFITSRDRKPAQTQQHQN